MDAIKRLKDTGTHFELVSGKELPNKKIVQIVTPQIYENKSGYAVFLCEVESED
jgi:hypothetical protein